MNKFYDVCFHLNRVYNVDFAGKDYAECLEIMGRNMSSKTVRERIKSEIEKFNGGNKAQG